MTARLIESLATTDSLAELFSDRSVLQALLNFEVALARAEARVRIVPRGAAESIAAAAKAEVFDVAALSRHEPGCRGHSAGSFAEACAADHRRGYFAAGTSPQEIVGRAQKHSDAWPNSDAGGATGHVRA